jgi:hypothetical protein
MKVSRLANTLDRRDLIVLVHHSQAKAGIHPASIDMDRACTALTMVTAFFCAG